MALVLQSMMVLGFAPDNAMELKENMVLTVEPGVYLPGFGGVRIEDDVLVKKDGLELLTKSSREFHRIRIECL